MRFVGGRDVDDRAVQLSVELRGPGITRIELGRIEYEGFMTNNPSIHFITAYPGGVVGVLVPFPAVLGRRQG